MLIDGLLWFGTCSNCCGDERKVGFMDEEWKEQISMTRII